MLAEQAIDQLGAVLAGIGENVGGKSCSRSTQPQLEAVEPRINTLRTEACENAHSATSRIGDQPQAQAVSRPSIRFPQFGQTYPDSLSRSSEGAPKVSKVPGSGM